mmetsp:Transcript_43835/g.88362  ORF Transcript_43835/g.88362 Transcript_43835/m.88362 type:complete len:252 (-) Transcript_43835:393-1148(-)
MRLKELFYLANIIDYGRIVLLYLAVQSSGYTFAAYYSGSYILDAFDGYAARALNQESRLGYYLDMVIDRISSCACLHFAANAVLSGETCFPLWLAPLVAFALRASILLVEILAHGVVMFMSEVRGVHQKQMGYDYTIVRLYLSDKRYLFFACVSFEAFGLGLIVNLTPLVLLSLPGFAFRAAANLGRLAAICLAEDASKWPDDQVSDGECPRRGSSDRLGHHRSASPPGAQVVRRNCAGSGHSGSGDSQHQ